jgi:putative nucleotidyltransferase with HDIG domain
MERNEAFMILKKYVSSESLLRHSFAVEASMVAYAKKLGEDEVLWGNVGLLHDIDFEKYPDEHPARAGEILGAHGFDADFIAIVESHGDDGIGGVASRTTPIKKALSAVDQMSSFIVAIALMRPTRLEGLAQKSVKKKMKDKAFAKAVDRDKLNETMMHLGVEFAEHVSTIVSGLTEHESLLNESGDSLF